MYVRHFTILFAAALVTQPLQARSPLEATGEIVGVRRASTGEATIVGTDGSRERALVSRYLFPGETVEAKGDTAILVRDSVQGRTITVTAASGPFRARGSATKPTSGSVAFLDRFVNLLTPPRREITVYTTGRDPARQLRRAPMLASPIQFLPMGAKRLALVWTGGAATIRVRGVDGKVRQSDISQTGSGAVEFDSFPMRIELISLAEAPITYEVREGRPPAPPWLDKYPEGSGDRIAAALWLIREGPPQWRLFGLSELEEQSRGNAAADRLWHAARTGEWNDWLPENT